MAPYVGVLESQDVKFANAVVEVGAWLLRRRRRFRVSGDSMLPTLAPDTFVLLNPRAVPTVGDLVVADHPTKDITICKRVGSVQDAGSLELVSDNIAAGQDSRHFGPVPAEAVHGVVSFVLARP